MRLHPTGGCWASHCAGHHPSTRMGWGPETQPLVKGWKAWLSSREGEGGKEKLGWLAHQVTWHPATPRASPGPHLALPPPRWLFPHPPVFLQT